MELTTRRQRTRAQVEASLSELTARAQGLQLVIAEGKGTAEIRDQLKWTSIAANAERELLELMN